MFCLTTHVATSLKLFHMAAGSTAVGGVSGAIFQGPCILIERVAVSVTFLLIVFKEDTDNIFVAADSHTRT